MVRMRARMRACFIAAHVLMGPSVAAACDDVAFAALQRTVVEQGKAIEELQLALGGLREFKARAGYAEGAPEAREGETTTQRSLLAAADFRRGTRIGGTSVETNMLNVTNLFVTGELIVRGFPVTGFRPTSVPTMSPTFQPTPDPTVEPTGNPPIADVVTTAMPVSSYNPDPSGSVCKAYCYQGTEVGPRAYDIHHSRYESIGGSFAMHISSIDYAYWPSYVGVDLSSAYPGGVALNQVTWIVHSNGFYLYDIEGSNDAGAWVNGNFDTSPSPNVLAGTWEVVAAGLKMNGYLSGLSDGTKFTNTFSNNRRYLKYRCKILSSVPLPCSPGTCPAFAVYGWQWNRV